MADRDDTIRDLAKLVRAALDTEGTAYRYADGVTSRLGLGEDDSAEAIEAGLREALGPGLDRERLGTVLSALEDAADYRREYQDGDCSDCDGNGYDAARPDRGKLCGDHDADEAVASMYDLLHGELQEHQGRGGAATAAGEVPR